MKIAVIVAVITVSAVAIPAAIADNVQLTILSKGPIHGPVPFAPKTVSTPQLQYPPQGFQARSIATETLKYPPKDFTPRVINTAVVRYPLVSSIKDSDKVISSYPPSQNRDEANTRLFGSAVQSRSGNDRGEIVRPVPAPADVPQREEMQAPNLTALRRIPQPLAGSSHPAVPPSVMKHQEAKNLQITKAVRPASLKIGATDVKGAPMAGSPFDLEVEITNTGDQEHAVSDPITAQCVPKSACRSMRRKNTVGSLAPGDTRTQIFTIVANAGGGLSIKIETEHDARVVRLQVERAVRIKPGIAVGPSRPPVEAAPSRVDEPTRIRAIPLPR